MFNIFMIQTFRSILSKTERTPETISVESIQERAVGLN